MITQPRLRPRGIAELLDASFQLYRNNVLTFLAIAALVLVPYNFLRFFLGESWEPASAQADNLAYFTSLFSNSASTSDTSWLGWLFSFLIHPIFYAACLLIAAQRYQHQPASITGSFRAAFQRAVSLIGVTILSVLVGLLAALPMLVFVCFAMQAYSSIQVQQILGSFGTNSALGNPSYMLPIVLGGVALLFSIPVIVVMARLSFAAHAIMLENLGADQSISRTWTLTRDYMWRIAVFSVIVYLLHMCFSTLPVGVITLGLVQLDLDQQLFSGLRLAAATIAEIIAAPFNVIAYTLMFFDLRFRNEALDLVENELFKLGDSDGSFDPALGMSPQ